MRRVSVVGCPGSGKTTVGRRLAASLGVAFIELDGIFHQPGWTALTLEQFRARATEAVSVEGWVVDGNYDAVHDLVWQRAEVVVWIDLPRAVVIRRVTLRTLRRGISRQELWNGNREPLSNFYRWDPDKNIIRWAWVKYPEYARRYRAAIDDPRYAHIRFVRLRSPREVDGFLAALPS